MKAKLFNKKIKGATLLEAMLGMMIGLIVVASAGKIYEVITSQVFVMKKNSDKMDQLFRLNMIMEHDFFKADKILKEDDITIKLVSPSDSLDYFFGEKFIIRKINDVNDTFFVSHQELLIEIVPNTNNNLSQKISFSAEMEKEKEQFVFKKNYPAEILINSLDNGNN